VRPEECQGRHDFKWNAERNAWVCLHCDVRWQDAPERKPLKSFGLGCEGKGRPMRLLWLNDGKADADGNFTVAMLNNSGGEITRFTGKSPEEIRAKLHESQVAAKRKLNG
jgi:hypothetical protein